MGLSKWSFEARRKSELSIRSRSGLKRKKLASAQRGPVESATATNERWSMAFITDRLDTDRLENER